MKRLFLLLILCITALLVPSCTNSAVKQTGRYVIPMNKAMFINQICDYEQSNRWNFLGTLPVIIDFYADWCGPCRMTSPIMEELAKEYTGQIIIYKVNVDKERELAALFGATSIPLFVFIPLNDQPQLFRGAADKATYKRIINRFLLKKQITE